LPAVGVAHPVQPLSDMRRPDAVCAQYKRPAGVAFRLQVCEYSIEPAELNGSRHLLANNALRALLANEVEPNRPEVALVGSSLPLSGV